MKALSVILALLLIALPLQARSCAVPDADASPALSELQHAGHAGHGPGHEPAGSKLHSVHADTHDCCAGMEAAPSSDCEGSDHCTFCPAGTLALSMLTPVANSQAVSFDRMLAEGQLPPAHAAPPYRPPGARC